MNHYPTGTGSLCEEDSINFKIAGIFHDYAAEQGFALMSRKNVKRLWQDDQINSMALYLKPEIQIQEIVQRVENDLIENSGNLSSSSELPLNVRSNTELRKISLSIFIISVLISKVEHHNLCDKKYCKCYSHCSPK